VAEGLTTEDAEGGIPAPEEAASVFVLDGVTAANTPACASSSNKGTTEAAFVDFEKENRYLGNPFFLGSLREVVANGEFAERSPSSWGLSQPWEFAAEDPFSQIRDSSNNSDEENGAGETPSEDFGCSTSVGGDTSSRGSPRVGRRISQDRLSTRPELDAADPRERGTFTALLDSPVFSRPSSRPLSGEGREVAFSISLSLSTGSDPASGSKLADSKSCFEIMPPKISVEAPTTQCIIADDPESSFAFTGGSSMMSVSQSIIICASMGIVPSIASSSDIGNRRLPMEGGKVCGSGGSFTAASAAFATPSAFAKVAPARNLKGLERIHAGKRPASGFR
jgi:hypothetical protein